MKEKKKETVAEINLSKPIETLARWWNTLNCWEWPEDLPGKPENFENMARYFTLDNPQQGKIWTKFDVISPINKAIKAKIGKKECLRYHHIHNIGRTNDEFEQWWNEESEAGDE